MGRQLIGRREIKFPVSDATYFRLRSEAQALGVPMVALIRTLIEDHLRAADEALAEKRGA